MLKTIITETRVYRDTMKRLGTILLTRVHTLGACISSHSSNHDVHVMHQSFVTTPPATGKSGEFYFCPAIS